MRRLIWSLRARTDLIAIVANYDRIDPTLVAVIVDRIEQAPLPLLHTRDTGSLAPDRARKWRVCGTPYLLFYDVREQAIERLAVHHVRSGWRA